MEAGRWPRPFPPSRAGVWGDAVGALGKGRVESARTECSLTDAKLERVWDPPPTRRPAPLRLPTLSLKKEKKNVQEKNLKDVHKLKKKREKNKQEPLAGHPGAGDLRNDSRAERRRLSSPRPTQRLPSAPARPQDPPGGHAPFVASRGVGTPTATPPLGSGAGPPRGQDGSRCLRRSAQRRSVPAPSS